MSTKTGAAEKLICLNKRAGHDYHLEKRYEAGMVLKGSEVKSCREGRVQLVDSFAGFEKDGVYLHKANIAEYKQGGPFFNHVPTRKRKLLLNKREITALKTAVEKDGYTVIPTRMYFKNGMAKVELALARGKNQGDKRASARTKDEERRIRTAARRDRD